MHGPDVGEAAACVADGDLCAGIALEEEQPGVSLPGINCYLYIGIDAIEDLLSRISFSLI